MIVQVFSATCRSTSRADRRIIGRGTLAAIFAGLGAISVSAAEPDMETGYSSAFSAPPWSTPAVRWSTPARSIDPPDRETNGRVQDAVLVDQLYETLMRSSGCLLASSTGSIGGGC